MKQVFKIALFLVLFTSSVRISSAQTYLKLNTLYALGGIINPQAEFTISPHSAFSTELVFSPWKSINNRHFQFISLFLEYRYFIRETNKGFYVSGNIGFQGFDISKPEFFHGDFVHLRSGWSKGWGYMLGIGIGWERKFRERWIVDIFASFDFMNSYYNGYNGDGTVILWPQGHESYENPDPWNGSSEWLPAKIGVSIGYRIFDPNRKKRK